MALPTLIPRSLLFGNPEKTAPRISPDGLRMTYLAPHPESGVLNIWLRTIGKDDARPITHDHTRPLRRYQWAWDNRHLFYFQDSGGDENWHLFLIDLENETAPARDLTDFGKVVASINASSPEHPQTVLVTINKREPSVFDVYKLTLPSGDLEIVAENPGNIISWVADDALKLRAATIRTPDGFSFQLQVRDTEDSDWRTVTTWGPDDQGSPWGFTKDGQGLYVTSNLDSDTIGLRLLDVATASETLLAESPLGDIQGALVNPRTHVVEAVGFDRARQEWLVLDDAVQEDLDALQSLYPEADVDVVDRNLDDTIWLIAFSSDRSPTRYFVWDRKTQSETFLFTTQPLLAEFQLAQMKPVEIPTSDGFSLPCYLTLPPGVDPKNLPMVLNVHGGPWARDGWGYDPEAQWLANRGYAVLQVNYRGSSGFGKKFFNAAKREFAGKMHDDLIESVQWAIDQGYADPAKVAIYGGSYGGYATLVGLTFTPETFACGVDIVGPSSLVSLIESFPEYWKPFLAKTWYAFVGDPSDAVEKADLEARSPLFKIDQIRKPLLIAQGANDPRVVQAESDRIVAKMREANLPVTYLLFPDEGHGFARPENRMKFYAAAEAFLAETLGGRTEPPHAGEEAPLA